MTGVQTCALPIYNLCRWLKQWMISALVAKDKMEQSARLMIACQRAETQQQSISSEAIRLTISSIEQRGIRRWVRQLFALDGVIVIKKGVVTSHPLNANYPLISRFQLAFETLLKPVGGEFDSQRHKVSQSKPYHWKIGRAHV